MGQATEQLPGPSLGLLAEAAASVNSSRSLAWRCLGRLPPLRRAWLSPRLPRGARSSSHAVLLGPLLG